MTQSRLDKLTASLLNSNLDAVILNPGPTLKYLTGIGFHLMERPVVLFVAPGKDPVLVFTFEKAGNDFRDFSDFIPPANGGSRTRTVKIPDALKRK